MATGERRAVGRIRRSRNPPLARSADYAGANPPYKIAATSSVFTNSLNQKISLAASGKSLALVRHPAPAKGTFRDRHDTLARAAMAAASQAPCMVRKGHAWPPDEKSAADGEVVWSWRRDRGVYPARLCGLGNGDNQRRSPGRARISRKPLRGESRAVSAVPVVFARALFALGMPVCSGARDLRAQSAPGFPCALSSEGDNELAKLRRNRAVRVRPAVSTSLRAKRPFYACSSQ